MTSRNKEHQELLLTPQVTALLFAMGFDPAADVEKLNIDYDLYAKGEDQVEAAYREVRGATDVLARVRDEVGARWTGSAAEQFDRYAEKVVSAGAAERGLLDAQDKATTEFFEEIKKNVQEAHDAIMKAVSGAMFVINPAMSFAVELGRLFNGTGDAPGLALPTDVYAAIEEVAKALGQIVDLPKKFGEAKFDSDIGSFALNDTADFRISADHSDGRVPTGLDDNEKDVDAWKER
ncbi:hypothetical protein SAMN05216553_113236 [Lentzea fradiae]|uniref:Uncharacterized protein n=1 Tax=Lentzea fradiae TaxID=200378 RepID=A0A1G7YDK8_9PSEU|nr:hypothetical protein [Lentzea fradiae]SDG94395.1 hypothetical protein SAMN05216553_113236 [Lentzea fradiae]